MRADTEHLAEILMGGLIDWDHDGGQAPEFAAGVREALLAATTRQQLAMVVDILGGLSAAGSTVSPCVPRCAIRWRPRCPTPVPGSGCGPSWR